MHEGSLFSKFEKIKHYGRIKYYDTTNYLNQASMDNLKSFRNNPTQAFVQEKQKFETRSIKIWNDPLNSSFEEPFMDQHRACFSKELNKYAEHQESSAGSLKPKNLLSKIFQTKEKNTDSSSLPKIIRAHGDLLSSEQVELLIIDLKREDKLYEFLEFMIQNVNEESIKEIIYLTNLVWEVYIPIQEMDYSESQIIEFSEELADNHLGSLDEKFFSLNCKEYEEQVSIKVGESKQRLNLFKKFVVFLASTVLMVIGGYFYNPYTENEENYYKRHLNGLANGSSYFGEEVDDREIESDDEESLVISKRIKMGN